MSVLGRRPTNELTRCTCPLLKTLLTVTRTFALLMLLKFPPTVALKRCTDGDRPTQVPTSGGTLKFNPWTLSPRTWQPPWKLAL